MKTEDRPSKITAELAKKHGVPENVMRPFVDVSWSESPTIEELEKNILKSFSPTQYRLDHPVGEKITTYISEQEWNELTSASDVMARDLGISRGQAHELYARFTPESKNVGEVFEKMKEFVQGGFFTDAITSGAGIQEKDLIPGSIGKLKRISKSEADWELTLLRRVAAAYIEMEACERILLEDGIEYHKKALKALITEYMQKVYNEN